METCKIMEFWDIWVSLDIINRTIYHYLKSKSSRRIFIKISLEQETQLECFQGEYSYCGSNKIETSSKFSFFMCELKKKIQKYWKVLPMFQNHNIERKIFFNKP